MSAGRRQLTLAVLCCLVGAGLAVFAATRTWAIELIPRPAPLPAVSTIRTGGDVLPWLPAIGLVGLAGAGAVLATRGRLRRLVGLLLLLVGLVVVGGGVYGVFSLDHGETGPIWPALCMLGGVLTAVSGAAAGAYGERWPSMGARYERRTSAGGATPGIPASTELRKFAATVEPGEPEPAKRRGARDAWDALDRGEDPTLD